MLQSPTAALRQEGTTDLNRTLKKRMGPLLTTSAGLNRHLVCKIHVFSTVGLAAKVLICVWSPTTMARSYRQKLWKEVSRRRTVSGEQHPKTSAGRPGKGAPMMTIIRTAEGVQGA